MLVKILIFVAALFLIYIFFFKNKRKIEIQKHKDEKKTLEGDTMVECVQCATFITDKDAIIKDGQFFCSKECARLL